MTTANETPAGDADPRALFALAQRALQAGRLADAVAAYRAILAQRPELAEIQATVGELLLHLGQLDDAEAHYLRALALKPSLAGAYCGLARVLGRKGQADQAIARLEQALTLDPQLVEAHYLLGMSLCEQGKLAEGAARLEQARALAPRLPAILIALSKALAKLENVERAIELLEEAITLEPGLAEAHNDLGCLFESQGKSHEAAAHLQKAVALRPDFVEAHNNLGTALKDLGQLAEAQAEYDRVLTLRPDHAGAHHNRVDLKKFQPDDPDLAAMEALAEPGRLPPDKQVYIHFALGKALEDVGQYDRAFGHLLEGNALKRREIQYDERAFQRTFQAIAERFDAELLEQFATAGDPSQIPIFIVGMPRSGSTLVEQILASHPQVHVAGELRNLHNALRALSDPDGRVVPYPSAGRPLDAATLRRVGETYLASLPSVAVEKTRISDKAPSNFFHIGSIRLILPGARIIHTTRDPVDTCVSCFSKLFGGRQAFSYDLAELGCYYRWYYELMAHWRDVLPAGAMLDVRYEDVVENLEEQARRLIDYCGLPWDDRCLSFHKTSRPIATASNVQVRQPIYRTSLARWRHYAAHLGPLLAELESCRQAPES